MIFDSSSSESHAYASSSLAYSNLEILFSPSNLTADEYILEYLEAHSMASGLTLVTDDRNLAMFAKESGVKHMNIEPFLKKIAARREKNQSSGGEGKPRAQSSKEFDRLLKIFEEKLKEDDHT